MNFLSSHKLVLLWKDHSSGLADFVRRIASMRQCCRNAGINVDWALSPSLLLAPYLVNAHCENYTEQPIFGRLGPESLYLVQRKLRQTDSPAKVSVAHWSQVSGDPQTCREVLDELLALKTQISNDLNKRVLAVTSGKPYKVLHCRMGNIEFQGGCWDLETLQKYIDWIKRHADGETILVADSRRLTTHPEIRKLGLLGISPSFPTHSASAYGEKRNPFRSDTVRRDAGAVGLLLDLRLLRGARSIKACGPEQSGFARFVAESYGIPFEYDVIPKTEILLPAHKPYRLREDFREPVPRETMRLSRRNTLFISALAFQRWEEETELFRYSLDRAGLQSYFYDVGVPYLGNVHHKIIRLGQELLKIREQRPEIKYVCWMDSRDTIAMHGIEHLAKLAGQWDDNRVVVGVDPVNWPISIPWVHEEIRRHFGLRYYMNTGGGVNSGICLARIERYIALISEMIEIHDCFFHSKTYRGSDLPKRIHDQMQPLSEKIRHSDQLFMSLLQVCGRTDLIQLDRQSRLQRMMVTVPPARLPHEKYEDWRQKQIGDSFAVHAFSLAGNKKLWSEIVRQRLLPRLRNK